MSRPVTPWHHRARRVLDDLIESGQPFTADNLIARCGHPDHGHAANGRNNAVGTLFRDASTAGRIVPIGVVKSSTPTRKGGMIRVWQGR